MASVGFIVILAQLAIIAAYRAAPAAAVAPFQYSQILWAVPFGMFIFGEMPDRWVALGAAIIISSGLFIVWRENRDEVSQTNPVLKARNLRPDAGPSPRPANREIH